MVAAVVDEVGTGLLDLGDQRGEVLVAGVQAFEQGHGDAFAFQGLLDRGGDAFTVLLLVVDHGDVGRLDHISDEVAGGRALHAVQADGAEHQFVATAGDVRAGGGGGDHQDAVVLIDVGSRLGGAGAQVADHELDLVVDDLVGHGNGLLRIAGIVVDHAFELLAVHAAGLVDLLDGHLGADELHLTILRDGTGGRAGQSDLDGVGFFRAAGQADGGDGGA
ncbi:hypothetical protein D9M69_416600 [compost metagenome]